MHNEIYNECTKTVMSNLESSSQQRFSAHQSGTHEHIFYRLHQNKTSIIDVVKRNALIRFKGHSVIWVKNPLQTTQGNVRSDRLCDTNVRHGSDMELCQALNVGKGSFIQRNAHSHTHTEKEMTHNSGQHTHTLHLQKQAARIYSEWLYDNTKILKTEVFVYSWHLMQQLLDWSEM